MVKAMKVFFRKKKTISPSGTASFGLLRDGWGYFRISWGKRRPKWRHFRNSRSLRMQHGSCRFWRPEKTAWKPWLNSTMILQEWGVPGKIYQWKIDLPYKLSKGNGRHMFDLDRKMLTSRWTTSCCSIAWPGTICSGTFAGLLVILHRGWCQSKSR